MDITLDDLLNEREVSKKTGISLASLRRRRWLNQPPKFYKLGASVKYKPTDVAAWIDSQPTGGTSAYRGNTVSLSVPEPATECLAAEVGK